MQITRTKVLAAAALPVVAGAVLIATNQFASAAGSAFPAHYAAPYLQIR
jgi:chitinase